MAKERDPRDRFIRVNGLRLHFLDWGGRSPQTVVFLHGGTGNAHDWDGMSRTLCDEYRIFSIDQRGHGDSDWSREGYWPHQMATDLHGFVQKMGIAPFNLVVQSLGVWTAIAYAGDHWRDVKRLVLTDFGPEVGREDARNIRAMIQDRPLGFRNSEEAVAWLQQAYPTRPKALLERRVRYGMRTNWAEKVVWKHDPDFTWITASAGLRATPYLWEQLQKIQCPTLVLRGDKSTILTKEILERMLAAMPSATGGEVPESWHFLFDENPEEFRRQVRAFLQP